jgi:hypothetical protein
MRPFSTLLALAVILATASAAPCETVYSQSYSQPESRAWVSGHYEWIGDTWGYVPGHWVVTSAHSQTTEVDRRGETVVYVDRPTERVVYIDPPPCQSTVVVAPACPPPVVVEERHCAPQHHEHHAHDDVSVIAPIPVPVPIPFIDPLFFLHDHHHHH